MAVMGDFRSGWGCGWLDFTRSAYDEMRVGGKDSKKFMF